MSYAKERLSHLTSVLTFLDKQKQFLSIKDQAIEFANLKGCLVYNFNITVDLGLMLECDAFVGNEVLSNPVESASLFQEIIYQYCLSHHLLPLDTTATQICTRLRTINFPIGCESLQINSIANLNNRISDRGLVAVTGVVVGMSGAAKYTQSTKYICPEETCEGHVGNHYIRMHVPGASEAQTIRNNFRCVFCAEILLEVKSARSLSDKIMLELSPISLCGPGQKESFRAGCTQPIPVLVRDELINIVKLGDSCQVVGITRTDVTGESVEVTLEANNVIKLDSCIPTKNLALPAAVMNIYNATQKSPWSFPLNMAFGFGDHIAPGGAMIKLRLLVLMSLVLNPQQNLLHMLCLGADMSPILALLQYAKAFSKRTFPVMVGTPLCGKVVNEAFCSWAPYCLQAGVLSLCSGGVCLCGDFGLWKKQSKDQLQAGGKIFLDLGPKHTGGLSQQLTLSLQCQVWAAYAPCTAKTKVTTSKDDFNSVSLAGDLSKTFLDSFSYISFLDSGNSFVDEEIYTQACYHNLASWCRTDNTADDTLLSHDDIETYVSIARQLEPEMSQSAESLIQGYYTAVRLARSSGLGGSDVPTTGFASLLSMATGFAKLRLSSSVEETDALMAAYLYEESLVSRLGLSILNVQPQPNISDACLSEFLGVKNDVTMHRFYAQLKRFCLRALSSRSTLEEE